MINKIDLINEKMQIGYNYYQNNKTEECYSAWIEVWSLIKETIQNNQIKSITDFDKTYNLTECLYNWASDFQEILMNSGNYEKCINYCEWLIPLYKKGDLNQITTKITIANSYYELNKREIGEKWFSEITEEHPQFAWGWINWSDQYWLFSNGNKDYKKGEEILTKALNIKNIEDKSIIYDRLLDLYRESGENEKAEIINQKIEKQMEIPPEFNFEILDGEKALKGGNIKENVPYGFGLYSDTYRSKNLKKEIGRNDPCPCGSGKKYKKCCLNS